MSVRIGDLATALFILGCASFAALQTIGWPTRTQVFPLSIALPLIAMLLAHLALVGLAVRNPRRKGVAAIVGAAEEPPRWLPDLRRGVAFAFWLAGYTVALWLLGFLVAGPAATFLFLRVFGRDSWLASAGFGVGVWAFLYVMVRIFRLPLHAGVITWPFS